MSAYARRNATVPSAGARVREGRIYNNFWNILGNFGTERKQPRISAELPISSCVDLLRNEI